LGEDSPKPQMPAEFDARAARWAAFSSLQRPFERSLISLPKWPTCAERFSRPTDQAPSSLEEFWEQSEIAYQENPLLQDLRTAVGVQSRARCKPARTRRPERVPTTT